VTQPRVSAGSSFYERGGVVLDRTAQAFAHFDPGLLADSRRARVISAWRTCGSSTGSASKTIPSVIQ
jgi:hypothetical protein